MCVNKGSHSYIVRGEGDNGCKSLQEGLEEGVTAGLFGKDIFTECIK